MPLRQGPAASALCMSSAKLASTHAKETVGGPRLWLAGSVQYALSDHLVLFTGHATRVGSTRWAVYSAARSEHDIHFSTSYKRAARAGRSHI